MEIAYSQCGDYLILNLVLSQEEQQPISKYGRMRRRYLKERRSVIYSNLYLIFSAVVSVINHQFCHVAVDTDVFSRNEASLI